VQIPAGADLGGLEFASAGGVVGNLLADAASLGGGVVGVELEEAREQDVGLEMYGRSLGGARGQCALAAGGSVTFRRVSVTFGLEWVCPCGVVGISR